MGGCSSKSEQDVPAAGRPPKPEQQGIVENIELCGQNIAITETLGSGFFGVVLRGRLASGEEIAVKRVHKAGEGLVKDDAEAIKELALEVILHKELDACASAFATSTCSAMVPKLMVGSSETLAAMELVPGASLFDWLRTPRRHDAADAAKQRETMKAVSWVAVRKVCTLLHHLAERKFSHRDMQDNNVMVRVLREPVVDCTCVDVWLIDFGKSMLTIDGELVTCGMPPAARQFNATADTVRFIMSILISLVVSYESAQQAIDVPWGRGGKEKFDWKASNVPDEHISSAFAFAERFGGWLSMAKTTLAKQRIENAMGRGENGDGKGVGDTLVSFARADTWYQRQLLTPYYMIEDEGKWDAAFLPERLTRECPLPETAGGSQHV